MEKKTLSLKSGVSLTEQDGRIGLSLNGQTLFAHSDLQASLIRVLSLHRQPLEKLRTQLCGRRAAPEQEACAALELASFILDFGSFLDE